MKIRIKNLIIYNFLILKMKFHCNTSELWTFTMNFQVSKKKFLSSYILIFIFDINLFFNNFIIYIDL
jgi:hypothetical protein